MKRFLSIMLFSALLLSTCALAEEGKATFYWNYDFDASGVVNDTGDIVTTMAFEYGKNISKVSEPEREEYSFSGWYLENGEEYNRLAKYTEDVNVYAKWSTKYTFEAEKTQLIGLDYECEENWVYDTVTEGGLKVGVALSGSANGTAMIASSLKASGGQYIAGLDYKGAYLDFEFTSDKAETGVPLSMRLSARFRPCTCRRTKMPLRLKFSSTASRCPTTPSPSSVPITRRTWAAATARIMRSQNLSPCARPAWRPTT